ncbi:MAG: histidine kinase [Flavobacteriales bacterium]|nr:histidine kinase [Flavobacteriales bacterium]
MINSKTLKKLITIFLHVSAWSLLFLFFLFSDEESDEGMTLMLSMSVLSLYFIPYLGLFYFNSLFNIKRYLITTQFRKYFILLFGSILVAISLESFIDYLEHLDCCADEESFSLKYAFLDNFFFSLFVLGLSFSYSFLIIWMNNEKLKNESELKLLKSQMNPHFLFNSLNTLYSLVSEKEMGKAEDAILMLSDILRYSVYQANDAKVSLEDEVNYIKNFISLQELRLAGKVAISFHCEGEGNNVFIEPMLLIPFVENAFKHGVSYAQESKISIELRLNGKELVFKVINTINETPKKMDDFSGVGIANVAARLELLYPKNHVLAIESKNGIHTVSLLVKKLG